MNDGPLDDGPLDDGPRDDGPVDDGLLDEGPIGGPPVAPGWGSGAGPDGLDVLETVPAALDGERVDRVIALLTGLTRAAVAALVDDGAVRLDDRTVAARGRRVRQGQTLALRVPAAVVADLTLVPDPSVAFHVVYADDDVIVIDKPAGLVVHPGAGNLTGTLVHGLLARYPELATLSEPSAPDRPGIVHRLDKGTSGLLVVARTAESRRSLVAQLADHSLRRVYTTVVLGTVDSDEGVIDAPLGRSGRDPTRITVDAGGRGARTHYRVEARYSEPGLATRLECRLETGRTHQIRVHLAAIGHPVLGDDRYRRDGPAAGGSGRSGSGPWGIGRSWEGPPGVAVRPFLHARELAFVHPRSGELVTFESPLAPDLAEVLAGFR